MSLVYPHFTILTYDTPRGTFIDMNSKHAKFRLVAEMDDGKVFAVKMSEEQTDKLNRVLENILGGKAQLTDTALGTSTELFPEAVVKLAEEAV